MARNRDSNPFLFPSDFPSYPSESSTTPSESTAPPSPSCSCQSAASVDSPYKSSPSPLRRLLSRSSSNNLPPAAFGPCAACEFRGRRCSEKCYVASFLPPNEAHKLAVVESVFGSGNFGSFLQKNSNASYIPLLLLLKDTSQEHGELNLDRRNPFLSETAVNNDLGVCISLNNKFRIRELMQELKVNLSSSFLSDTYNDNLLHNILSSFEKSLSILFLSELQNASALIDTASNDPESPIYMCDSPGTCGVNFDGVYSEPSKKRKLLATSIHVPAGFDNELEGNPVDGFLWRKYGQKVLKLNIVPLQGQLKATSMLSQRQGCVVHTLDPFYPTCVGAFNSSRYGFRRGDAGE